MPVDKNFHNKMKFIDHRKKNTIYVFHDCYKTHILNQNNDFLI